MGEERNITRAAAVIGGATFISRILGYLRDMVVARGFGDSPAADAFYVAYRIPNLLREMLAEGSISAAFIPVFTEYLTKRTKDETVRLANASFTIILILLSGISLIGIIFTPTIVALIAPGFAGEAGKAYLTIIMTRIMFPFLLFIGIAAQAMGILNSLRSFTVPALAPAMFNIAIIVSTLLISPMLDRPILGVAIGVLLGGIVQFLYQVPSMKKVGFPPRILFDPFHPGVKRIALLILPVMIGLSVSQINILVNTILASYLPDGSVTYLYYGMRLIHLPLGMFGVAVATAILPAMSTQVAKGEIDEMRKTLSFGMRLVLFITFPAIAGLIFFRVPIIHLLFQHGEFSYKATTGTATALLYYSLGLWAFAGVRIAVPAFYSMQDTTTPVKVAVLSLAVNIALNILLISPLGHGGLALASSISSSLNLLFLLWILRGKIGRIDGRNIARSSFKALIASAIIILLGIIISHNGIWGLKGSWGYKTILLGSGMGLSIAGYLIIHAMLKTEELVFLFDLIRKRRGR